MQSDLQELNVEERPKAKKLQTNTIPPKKLESKKTFPNQLLLDLK